MEVGVCVCFRPIWMYSGVSVHLFGVYALHLFGEMYYTLWCMLSAQRDGAAGSHRGGKYVLQCSRCMLASSVLLWTGAAVLACLCSFSCRHTCGFMFFVMHIFGTPVYIFRSAEEVRTVSSICCLSPTPVPVYLCATRSPTFQNSFYCACPVMSGVETVALWNRRNTVWGRHMYK